MKIPTKTAKTFHLLTALFLVLAAFTPGLVLAEDTDETYGVFLPTAFRTFAFSGPATVTGEVYSALVGKQGGEVSGASVCVKNTTRCALTNTTGMYEITDLASGIITLVVTKDGYAALERAVQIIAGQNTIDLPISPLIEADQFRIVVTWQAGIDLDANLWLPRETPYYVNAAQTGATSGLGNCDVFPYAELDNDSVDGSKPETITICEVQPGEYTFAVYHILYATQTSTDPAYAFDKIGVTVDVYDDTGLALSIQPPTPADPLSVFWKVFTLDLSDPSDLTVVNTISNIYPVQLPYPP